MSNDETQPVSGSRWEPAPGGDAAGVPAAPVPTQPSPAYAAAPPPSRRRGRLALAGGAAGIVLVSGAGGFALGHATADDGRDAGQFGRFGPGGPQRGLPGNGQLPPGFQNGPGAQGVPGDPDGDTDGHDDGFGFPGQSDQTDPQANPSEAPEGGGTQGSSNT